VAESPFRTVERAIAAFNSGDLNALLESFEPDAEWLTTLQGALHGPHRGHDGLESLFRGWWEAWENVSLDFEELRESGELALGKCHFRGRARSSGEEVAVDRFWLFEVHDAAIARVVSYDDQAEALDAMAEVTSRPRA
jgi:ketosteroid isomerase-like protein